jgi:hypothetical protein
MQIHVGTIAASVPTLKPLFKKNTTTSNNNQYDDIERPQTFGSAGKPARRRKTFLTTNGTLMGNDNFELSTRASIRESVLDKFGNSGQDKKNAVYSVTEERIGSEDNMLSDKKELEGIRCTTEFTVDHTERQAQS